MRDPVAHAIARLTAQLNAAERRLAMEKMMGKVKQKDADKRRLRLTLGKNSRGEDVLSGWVRWQESAAGGMKVHSEPAENEQMMLVNIAGTVGSASIAVPGTYDDDHSAPSKSSDTAVLERGGGRIELGPSGILLKGNVKVEGSIHHDDVDIGKTHKHKDVQTGVDVTGVPI